MRIKGAVCVCGPPVTNFQSAQGGARAKKTVVCVGRRSKTSTKRRLMVENPKKSGKGKIEGKQQPKIASSTARVDTSSPLSEAVT
jgi:hypothetical protein